MSKKLNIINEGGSCSTKPKMNSMSSGAELEADSFQGRAAVITLGCAKNQVDSEVMLGVLKKSGYEIVSDVARADIAIVNTCGFLQSSVKESIDCILEVAEHKQSGQLRKLIVAGCLVERYLADLKKTLPEVDSFITIDDLLKVGEVADGSVSISLDRAARPYFLYDERMPREISTGKHTAYIKVSEGCNRPCTFCIIPKLRGGMRSRTIESIVSEVKSLSAGGIKEFNLIAQDLTSFGTDRKDGNLSALLCALDQAGDARWIRLLYSYPIGIDKELLDTIVESRSIVEYLDLPLQHSSDKVLKEMKRPLGRYSPRSIVEFIRSTQPSIHLRTTFIVGFPGETEEDVDDLEQFILDGHFTNVGIFTYSPEEGTPSALMDKQIPEGEKKARRARLMEAQQYVVQKRAEQYIGQEIEVLVDGPHADTELLISARARFQAPEVDGTVLINDIQCGDKAIDPGVIGTVKITETAGYDLVGTLVKITEE